MSTGKVDAPQTDKVQPAINGPNPYRVIRDCAKLDIEARPWRDSNGMAIDRDGKAVWANDRCSAVAAVGVPSHEGLQCGGQQP